VEDEVDSLFKLPLGEFVPARNALVAQLKKAGEHAEADAVRAQPKPSVAAWVVNQLYWRYRAAFDRLLEAGDRSREIQSTQRTRGAADVRENLEARREAQAALMRMAADVLRADGYSGARDMLRRVAGTLEALATYGSLPDAPRAGRLTAELQPSGFDLAAGLLPAGGAARPAAAKLSLATGRAAGPKHSQAPKTARSDSRRAREAAVRNEAQRQRLATAAKAAVHDAERALRAARTRVERGRKNLAAAVAHTKKSERLRVQSEKELAKRITDANAAREREREADEECQRTTQSVEAAARALELAREKLAQLDGKRK
jgi:hypothetical protein